MGRPDLRNTLTESPERRWTVTDRSLWLLLLQVKRTARIAYRHDMPPAPWPCQAAPAMVTTCAAVRSEVRLSLYPAKVVQRQSPPENHCVIRAICELHPHQDAPRLAGIVLHASFAGQRCSVVSGAEAEQRRSVKVQSCRAHRAVMDELKHAARKRSPVASVFDTRKRWIRARDAGMPMRAICTGSPNHDITHMLRRRCAQHKLS